MGRSRYTFVHNDCPHSATCTILNWIALFGNTDVVQIILDSLKFMVENKRMTIHGWVIMENHLHLLASAFNLSKEIHDLRSFTARRIIDFLEENHFASLLDQFRNFKKEHKLDYIHYNPVRRGYVEDPSYWRYSSYVDYHDGRGLLPIEIIGL